jgi:hypothetical protein
LGGEESLFYVLYKKSRIFTFDHEKKAMFFLSKSKKNKNTKIRESDGFDPPYHSSLVSLKHTNSAVAVYTTVW